MPPRGCGAEGAAYAWSHHTRSPPRFAAPCRTPLPCPLLGPSLARSPSVSSQMILMAGCYGLTQMMPEEERKKAEADQKKMGIVRD